MGHKARLRIIRDRFIAGHGSCELCRHLDSVAPETSIWNIVDRCRVWESHADSEGRYPRGPGPERALSIYMVDDVGGGRDDQTVAAATTSPTAPEQLESLLRWLLPTPVVPPPSPKPVPSDLEQLLQRLLGGAQTPHPAPPVKTGITVIETLLQNLLPVSLSPDSQTQLGPGRRDWATVLCFSCGTTGHGATQCPVLDVSFPFLLPEWKAKKVGSGYVMISPRVVAERRQPENGD